MQFIVSLLLGIAVNLDNFLIGFGLGSRGQKLSLRANGLMAAMTGLFAYVGVDLAQSLSQDVAAAAKVWGALALMGYGFWCGRPRRGMPEEPPSYTLGDLRQILGLGAVLAINCLPPALSAGAVGLSPLPVVASTTLCSLFTMALGNRLGFSLSAKEDFQFLSPLSAWLLLLIGAISLVV